MFLEIQKWLPVLQRLFLSFSDEAWVKEMNLKVWRHPQEDVYVGVSNPVQFSRHHLSPGSLKGERLCLSINFALCLQGLWEPFMLVMLLNACFQLCPTSQFGGASLVKSCFM